MMNLDLCFKKLKPGRILEGSEKRKNNLLERSPLSLFEGPNFKDPRTDMGFLYFLRILFGIFLHI